MDDGIDLNVENYTIEELFKIFKMSEPDYDIIEERVNELKKIHENDPELYDFFEKAFKKILDNIAPEIKYFEDSVKNNHGDYDDETDQFKQWASYQNINHQVSEAPSRRQKIDVFGNNHGPMKQEKIDIKHDFSVPIAQGDINPRLTNTTTRITNIDSKYRKNVITDVSFSTVQNHHISQYSPTDYTIELTEPLTNVLSLRLYSLHVPYTWYNIDSANDTNSFTFIGESNTVDGETGEVTTIFTTHDISLNPGNYTATDIDTALTANSNIASVSYNAITGKFSITFGTPGTIIFYDEQNEHSSKNNFKNNNLGWIMGFRDARYQTDVTMTIEAEAPFIRHNTKYLLLSLEDFNQNHVTNRLVGIKNKNKPLDMPSYRPVDISENEMINNCTNDISNNQYATVPVYTQGFPRQITQAQQYTLNEIAKSRKRNTTANADGPSITDLFAVVPIKTSGLSIGDPITEFSGGIQSNVRNYFGPVNIERLRVRLLDDMGHILNLNGCDWSFVIVSEHLYQY